MVTAPITRLVEPLVFVTVTSVDVTDWPTAVARKLKLEGLNEMPVTPWPVKPAV